MNKQTKERTNKDKQIIKEQIKEINKMNKTTNSINKQIYLFIIILIINIY